ncbi:hypothetical protein HZ326_0501 [Fusarium oxysporum f. sp. albedinis]|nr:hypothetical protein HZ326_0501 [Fusarium oxysporum f. sp. albedinis]
MIIFCSVRLLNDIKLCHHRLYNISTHPTENRLNTTDDAHDRIGRDIMMLCAAHPTPILASSHPLSSSPLPSPRSSSHISLSLSFLCAVVSCHRPVGLFSSSIAHVTSCRSCFIHKPNLSSPTCSTHTASSTHLLFCDDPKNQNLYLTPQISTAAAYFATHLVSPRHS